MKKAIIFDLDGTLWNSLNQVVPSWNAVLKRHNTGCQVTQEQMQGQMGKLLDNIAPCVMPNLPREKAIEIARECCREEDEYIKKYGGVLYPDLEETLDILKKDYSLYVVSNCQCGYIEAFLYYHKFTCFEDTLCAGQTGMNKGDNIKLIVEKHGVDKAIYVGDTQLDMEAAEHAKVAFIHAAYGFGKVNKKVPEMHHFKELIELSKDVFEKEQA